MKDELFAPVKELHIIKPATSHDTSLNTLLHVPTPVNLGSFHPSTLRHEPWMKLVHYLKFDTFFDLR